MSRTEKSHQRSCEPARPPLATSRAAGSPAVFHFDSFSFLLVKCCEATLKCSGEMVAGFRSKRSPRVFVDLFPMKTKHLRASVRRRSAWPFLPSRVSLRLRPGTSERIPSWPLGSRLQDQLTLGNIVTDAERDFLPIEAENLQVCELFTVDTEVVTAS